ncbi:MAG: hypothetical protein HY549_04215 [Elusimicrobia bacterium]|nr:hypothetical protein [Elusimicrobiota bacterium]
MTTIWADGWFYISGGGFLISSVLFVFLLNQYRAAIESEDESVSPEDIAPMPKPEVYIPKPVESPAPAPVAEPPQAAPGHMEMGQAPRNNPPYSAAPKPVELPQVKAAEPPAERRKSETTTGGLSPAVVYLQNLTMQMAYVEKELAGLRSTVSQQAAQSELILQRLADLNERFAQQTFQVMAPTPSSAPESSQPSAAAADPIAELEKTIVLQPAPLSAAATEPEGTPPTAAEPAPQAELKLAPPPQENTAEQGPEAKPGRKGPVWPI